MSNNDVKTDVEEKQAQSGKKNPERNSKSTHDERNKKTQHARHTGAGKDSRTGRHGNGGRDSAHSHKHKRDTSDHPNSKHRNKDSSSGQTWAGHNRTDKFNNTAEGSHGRHRGHSKHKTPLEAKDSGISIDESSSPEQQLAHKQNTQTTITPGEDSESPLVVAIGNGGNHTSTESPECDGIEREKDKQEKETQLPRHVYTRDDLLSLRNCAASILYPGLLRIELPIDVAKSSSTEGDVKETLLEQEDLTKQVGSLSTLNKEHHQDPKGVSLMPQRRSFGSGCSWRDSTPLLKHATDEEHKGEERTSDIPWSVAGQQGTHPPKVIDHVPFRSRGGKDWKSNKGSNWKDKNSSEFHGEEDEPEWMSFGPDDKYEFMELKGIEEHEIEREARREADMKEREGGGEESPISPCLDKYDPKNELVDSGLPSSYHNEDEDGYMLDGFDFKSVLSICRELASDDSNDDDKVDKDSLYKAKDTYELKNALISVLGISREEQEMKDHAHLTGPPRSQHVKKHLTLDEIEGQTSGHAQSQDSDQSAFNKFIASMAPPTSQSPPNVHNTRNSAGEFGLGSHPLKAPPKSSNRFIPTDNQSFQDFPSHYQTPHSPRSPFFPSSTQFGSPRTNDSHAHINHTPSSQPHPSLGWTPPGSWEGGVETHSKPHLLNPSPSSIGMHPHHMKHSHSGGGGAGSSWVSEMEQVRLSELKHQQQHQYHQERQARIMHHQHQLSMPPPSQKPTGHAPSLGFLPTSVMRHMHNSKPNQLIKDITRSNVPTGRSDDDFMQQQSPEMGGYQSRPSSESPYHHVGGVYSAPHYRYPGQYHSSYWPNIRGDGGQGYHAHQPRPPVQQQFMRMGSSPVKPGMY